MMHGNLETVINSDCKIHKQSRVWRKEQEQICGKTKKNGFLLKTFLHDNLMVVQKVKKFYAVMEPQS